MLEKSLHRKETGESCSSEADGEFFAEQSDILGEVPSPRGLTGRLNFAGAAIRDSNPGDAKPGES